MVRCFSPHHLAVLSHRRTPLSAHLPVYLYPFLETTARTAPLERLRTRSLHVIEGFARVRLSRLFTFLAHTSFSQHNDDTATVRYLLSTQIVPICLAVLENDCYDSQVASIVILENILTHDEGLAYFGDSWPDFNAFTTSLNNVVDKLPGSECKRLVRHIVLCFLRLCDDERCVGPFLSS